MASPISSIDDIRSANPDLGVAIYAYEPGQPVTLELITPAGDTYSFEGLTLAEAIAAAFPPDAPAASEIPTDIFD